MSVLSIQNPAIDYGHKRDNPGWETLELEPKIVDTINKLDYDHPTKIQVRLEQPTLLYASSNSCICIL